MQESRCPDGFKWNQTQKNCVALAVGQTCPKDIEPQCTSPPYLQNAKSHYPPGQQYFDLGSTVRYTCLQDYTANTYTDSARCVGTGQWTGPNMTCTKCPQAWIRNGQKCYRYFGSLKTWNDAKSDCRKYAGPRATLAEPRNGEQDAFIRGLVDRSTSGNVWLGARDTANEGHWIWDSDQQTMGYWRNNYWYGTWADWYRDSGRDPNQDCLIYWHRKGYRNWDDDYCWERNRYVCEKPSE